MSQNSCFKCCIACYGQEKCTFALLHCLSTLHGSYFPGFCFDGSIIAFTTPEIGIDCTKNKVYSVEKKDIYVPNHQSNHCQQLDAPYFIIACPGFRTQTATFIATALNPDIHICRNDLCFHAQTKTNSKLELGVIFLSQVGCYLLQ